MDRSLREMAGAIFYSAGFVAFWALVGFLAYVAEQQGVGKMMATLWQVASPWFGFAAVVAISIFFIWASRDFEGDE